MNELTSQENNLPVASKDNNPDKVRATDVLMKLVTFELLNEEFGIPIIDVREIIQMLDITPVPNAPKFVEGVVNLRGQIIPIVDMRKRFNLEAAEMTEQNRIVVIEVNYNSLGLIVDGNSEVLNVPADLVKPAPSLIAGGIGSEYIKGIAYYNERMIILIDLYKIFSQEELSEIESSNL